jgi:hypothetical protein
MPSPLDPLTAVVGRVQREVVLARFLGKLAVDQGLAQLRHRLASPPSSARSTSAAESRTAGPDPAAPVDGPTTDGAPPDVTALALADYDSLPASAIVAKLDGLEPAELDAIEVYERQGRGRRTVLGRIGQLRS